MSGDVVGDECSAFGIIPDDVLEVVAFAGQDERVLYAVVKDPDFVRFFRAQELKDGDGFGVVEAADGAQAGQILLRINAKHFPDSGQLGGKDGISKSLDRRIRRIGWPSDGWCCLLRHSSDLSGNGGLQDRVRRMFEPELSGSRVESAFGRG